MTDSTSTTISVPTKVDFAQEVRTERLSALWKITLILTALVVWVALIATALSAGNLVNLIPPVVSVAIGCLLCRSLLSTNQFIIAVWTYALGLFIAIALMMYAPVGVEPHTAARDFVPFMFPLIIFMVGLLLPIRITLIATALSIVLTLFVPMINHPVSDVNQMTPQFFAILVILLATGVAAQMSGDLYGIAEWALANYRRERDVAGRLYDSQQEIQRSLLRQQGLTEQVQESNRELEVAQAAALEAKNFRGQFLANMSHELRTPLNAIIGFSEAMLNYPMMYSNETLPDGYKQDLDQINTSGKHLLALINDILDLSKVDAGKLDLEIEKVDVDELIKGVLATAAGLKGDKPIKLRRDTPEKLPIVRGDSLRVRQIMLNVLSNAAKFTDKGTITIGAREQDGEVVFWIRDTGIGIAPDEMSKIFEEFRQGTSGRRRGRAGSGLGLAISRQLLNLMGGRIWAESTLGEGSTFFFALPIYKEEPVAPVTQGS